MSRVAKIWVHAGLVALMSTSLVVTPGAAQSPGTASPPASCAPSADACPSPSPSPGIVWPPMAFAGGAPDLILFTSSCGVWGRDPITLTGEGPAGSAVMVLTLTDYDSANFRWSGQVTGNHTALNGTSSSFDEPATVAYDLGTGDWVLQAFWAQGVLAVACAPSSPAPA